MKRRIWIIVSAVTLTVAGIGGVAALTDGDSEAGDTSPSLGVPAPGSENIDETVVLDGSDGDVAVLPPYDGPADGLTTEEPIEEPGDEAGRAAEERARALEGGAVANGEFTEEGGEAVVGDGPVSSGMAVPGFEGTVNETVVVVGGDELADDVDDGR
jgi:hypothetical protein